MGWFMRWKNREKVPRSAPMTLDESAATAKPDLPAFLAPPAGAPAYHGFPLVPSTTIDGWIYGTISRHVPGPVDFGDGFVQAPDGSRAGIVWQLGTGDPYVISPPNQGRWGVNGLYAAIPIDTEGDLHELFNSWLPHLKAFYLAGRAPVHAK